MASVRPSRCECRCAGLLEYLHYNFVRIHRTLRVPPAIQAGLTNRVWSIQDIIGLLEMAEKEPAA